VRAPGWERTETCWLTLQPRASGDRSVFMTDHLVQYVGADRVLETSRCLLRYPETSDVSPALNAFTSQSFPGRVPLGQSAKRRRPSSGLKERRHAGLRARPTHGQLCARAIACCSGRSACRGCRTQAGGRWLSGFIQSAGVRDTARRQHRGSSRLLSGNRTQLWSGLAPQDGTAPAATFSRGLAWSTCRTAYAVMSS
jgi:hypothetical protein